ncbi:thioredoxin domain-containing protein, partial [Salmonella sp. s51228]|uniref:thioredoxin domain-containing protein n=1 Tax=Salmonella sp. s51228 TaxID=3159652 RepID=UPI0039815D87
ELAKRFNVAGYPTIKFFKGGEPQDYKGPRNANGIVEWLLKKTGPVTSTIESEDDFNTFKNKNEYCVVGFFEKLDDKEAITFSSVAEQIEDTRVG